MTDDLTSFLLDPIKLNFYFFSLKLGHFKNNEIFLYVTNMQAYQKKTEKFFGCEEKKVL
jgi:hypothetical protein